MKDLGTYRGLWSRSSTRASVRQPLAQPAKAGFTLVELLVVIAIIAILAAVSIGAFGAALRYAQRIKCAGNLHTIGIALQSFAGDNNEQYPQTGIVVALGQVDAGTGKPSWMEQLDPYDGANHAIFICPSVHNGFVNNYYLMSWAAFYANGMKYPTPAVRILQVKNSSAMILAGDNSMPSGGDADPDDAAPTNYLAFGGPPIHGKFVNLLFVDGHVQAFSAFDKNEMTNRYEGLGYDYNSQVP